MVPTPLSLCAAAHGVSHRRGAALHPISEKGHETPRDNRIGQEDPAIVGAIGPISLPANRCQELFVFLTIERARSVGGGIAILAPPNFRHALVREA